MPAVNGVTPPISPPSVPAVPPAKRKHDDISSDALVNGENTANDRNHQPDISNSLRDIWDVLNAQRISPIILKRLSSYHTTNDSSNGPSTKRAKRSSSSSQNVSIPSKVANGDYESFEAFVTEIEEACEGLIASDNIEPDSANSMTQEQERLAASLVTMKKFLTLLVNREKQRHKSTVSTESPAPKLEHDDEVKVNGVGHIETAPAPAQVANQSSRTVLTLFGNAQGHKQLFSSLQKPVAKSGLAQHSHVSGVDLDPGTFVPLREGSLPMGISGTKVVPAPQDDPTKTKKPRRTFRDVFPPPPTVRALAPPKTPKLPASRESSVTWSKASSEQTSRPSGYANEKLSTGTWLGYGGVAPADEPTSPQAKRKQRDRALSVGDPSLTPSRVAKAAQLQAQEEALFRSAYSSFAPSRDNSAAIIPEQTRNEMWWDKYGAHYFHQAFAVDPALEVLDEAESAKENTDDKESLFKEAVEQFVPPSFPVVDETTNVPADKDAEETLLEISQMLETLHSHQRIRMSTLSAGSRTSLVQNSPLQELTGGPSTPSTAEVETYKTLKAQLSLIISLLPPYAVAKLNGEQLADLNISRGIPMEVEEYRGVMEEDKPSRDAKQAAFQAAVGVAVSNNRPPPLQATAQNQVRSAQMPQSARGPGQNHLQYNNTPQTMPRAQSQFSRQPLSSWQKPNQNYNASIQRPAYANAQNYNQQMPRNPNSQPRPQQPYTPMQHPGRPPNLTQLPNGVSNSAPQVPFQQRMQNQGSPSYAGGNGGLGISPSPSKNMQQSYTPQMQFQLQNQMSSMQTPFASQMSPQQKPQLPQSPQPHQPGNQSQPQSSPPSQSQLQQQPPAPPLSASPLPRPSSAAGPGNASASGDTDGAAVTSRSETPSTPAPDPAPTQSQVPPVANMTPITQE